jgi:hypothetical protein
MKNFNLILGLVLLILLSSCARPQEELNEADEIAIDVIERTYYEFEEDTYYIYTLEYYVDENPDDENKIDYYFHINYQTTNGIQKGVIRADVLAFWDGSITIFNTNSIVGDLEPIYEKYLELVDNGKRVNYSTDEIDRLMSYVIE